MIPGTPAGQQVDITSKATLPVCTENHIRAFSPELLPVPRFEFPVSDVEIPRSNPLSVPKTISARIDGAGLANVRFGLRPQVVDATLYLRWKRWSVRWIKELVIRKAITASVL